MVSHTVLFLLFESSHATFFLVLFVFPVSSFKLFLPSLWVKIKKKKFSHLQKCFSLVILVFSVKMGFRHRHTGTQIPAATKPTFQSPDLGPVYWSNALRRCEELIKQITVTTKFCEPSWLKSPSTTTWAYAWNSSLALTLRALKQKERHTSERSLLSEREACQRPRASHQGLCYCYWLDKEGSQQHTAPRQIAG